MLSAIQINKDDKSKSVSEDYVKRKHLSKVREFLYGSVYQYPYLKAKI